MLNRNIVEQLLKGVVATQQTVAYPGQGQIVQIGGQLVGRRVVSEGGAGLSLSR